MAKPNDKIDEAVAAARETTVPLLIRRRCTPHQQAVWIAISFLLQTHPRADFGLREIAQEVGTKSYPRVSGWVDELVKKGLLERETPEEASTAQDNFPLIRSKYAIPRKYILEASLELADDYVRYHVRGGNRLRTAKPPECAKQQSLFETHVTEGSHGGVTEGSHGGVTEGSHGGVTEGSHDCDRLITLSCDPSVTDGWDGMGWDSLDGMGESRARKKRGPGRPPAIPPPPPAEVYAQHPTWAIGGPLPSHPRELWANACPRAAPSHDDLLAALAAQHDGPTEGYGWYWVGRAILAGTTAQDSIGHINYLHGVMTRWRDEDSYGSHLPDRRPAKERPNASRPRPVGSRPRRAAVPVARPAPHLSAGLPPDDLSDDDLAAIEDAAGAEFARRNGGS